MAVPVLTHKDIGSLQAVTAETLDADPGLAVSAKQCLLYGITGANAAAAITYIQMFNKAAVGDVTLGTTAPDAWVAIAASANIAAWWPIGVLFTTGLVVFSTTTATGNTGATSHLTFWVGK